jgi:rare lipoprotein A (peptidoglycan hydrolase)
MKGTSTTGMICLLIGAFIVFCWVLVLEAFAGGALDGSLEGQASWYGGPRYQGRPMANREPFDERKPSVASRDWPLGTELWVCSGDRAIRIFVTDVGPAKPLRRKGRIIDLSKAAFAALLPEGVTPEDVGLIDVLVWPVGKHS